MKERLGYFLAVYLALFQTTALLLSLASGTLTLIAKNELLCLPPATETPAIEFDESEWANTEQVDAEDSSHSHSAATETESEPSIPFIHCDPLNGFSAFQLVLTAALLPEPSAGPDAPEPAGRVAGSASVLKPMPAPLPLTPPPEHSLFS
ncbi:MAG: hypothetical protein HY645_08620 [Acidobacteria bacterium]|nr:hypothetical protein [Acidobacteriota bacterium]